MTSGSLLETLQFASFDLKTYKYFYKYTSEHFYMNSNTMVVWKPTAAEATFLYGKLEGYQSSYGSITDVAISIRILGEFKSHFSGTQRVPPIEVSASAVGTLL